jgi:hypothetical protein
VLATPIGRKPHIDEASDSARHFEGDERRSRRTFARVDRPFMTCRTDERWI